VYVWCSYVDTCTCMGAQPGPREARATTSAQHTPHIEQRTATTTTYAAVFVFPAVDSGSVARGRAAGAAAAGPMPHVAAAANGPTQNKKQKQNKNMQTKRRTQNPRAVLDIYAPTTRECSPILPVTLSTCVFGKRRRDGEGVCGAGDKATGAQELRWKPNCWSSHSRSRISASSSAKCLLTLNS